MLNKLCGRNCDYLDTWIAMEVLTVFYVLATLLISVIFYSTFKLYKYVRAERLRLLLVEKEHLERFRVEEKLEEERLERFRVEEKLEEERLRVEKEQEWRRQLLLAMDTVYHNDKTHDIGYLLEEPQRKPEYTLDFCYTRSRNSPLMYALDRKCSICLVKLLEAGASVHYLKDVGYSTALGTAINAKVENYDDYYYDEDIYEPKRGRSKPMELMEELLIWGANDNDGHRNLDQIFEVFSWYDPYGSEYGKDEAANKNILHGAQFIMLHGYRPDINSDHAQTFFCQALKHNTVESNKVVSIMLDQLPMMLQRCWELLYLETIDPKYEHQLENVPSLQSLCKGVIIGTMGQPYVGKVKYLPLPLSIRESLELKHHLN